MWPTSPVLGKCTAQNALVNKETGPRGVAELAPLRSNICVLHKVETSENLADFFTKILDVHRFTGLRDKLMKPHRCTGDKHGACQHRHGTVTAPSGGLTGHM